LYVMFILIAFSLAVSLIFLAAYFWSVRSGQFDDKYTPSVRILFDDKGTHKKTETDAESVGNHEENQ